MIAMVYVCALIYVLCFCSKSVISVPISEYLALQDFYNALHGDHWLWRVGSDSVEVDDDYVIDYGLNINHGPRWNFTGYHDPCQEGWQGINCTCSNSSSGFDFTYSAGTNCSIAVIELEDYNLVGQLPMSMSNFTELRVLFLRYNAITGSIPVSLGNLTNLHFLSLAHNEIASTIPSELGNCSQLTRLHLDYNDLVGPIPESLFGLAQLTYLNLEYNSLHGQISPLIGRLTKLQNLHLNNNQLYGTIPEEIAACSQITELDLYSNDFYGSIPEAFHNMTGMRFLSIYDNAFTGTVPTWIGSDLTLATFDAGYNQLEGSITDVFGCNHSTPFGLFINNNFITGPLPRCLGGNDSLVAEMLLSSNIFTGPIPAEFAENLVLQGLFISHNMLTGTIPQFASPMLRVLYVENNQFVGNLYNVFDPAVQKDLQYIDFGDNQFTGTIPSNFYQLKSLRSIIMVSNCITGGISDDICNLSLLQYLDLEGLLTADSCQQRIFPFLRSYVLKSPLTGTIPPCLFSLKMIETLHLAGNAIDSGLPKDLEIGPRMTDIVLSHNRMRGDIPISMQTRKFNTLDLSYNCFTGGLHPKFNISSQTKLEVNRLSGAVPAAFRNAVNVTLLNSNLFDCDLEKSTLPLNDPDYSDYECASNSFNESLIVWLLGVIPTVLLLLGGFAVTNDVVKSPDMKKWFSKYIEYYQKWMKAFEAKEGATEQSPLVELDLYLRRMRFTVVRLTVGICVILLPMYFVLSHYYASYTHEYAWSASALYLSGETPAVILMVSFALLLLSIFASLHEFLWRWMKNEIVVDHATSNRSQVTRDTLNLVRFLGLCGVAVINCCMMIALNGIYVHFVFEYSSGVVTVCQIVISMFKIFWNEWAVSRLVKRGNDSSVGAGEKASRPASVRAISVDLERAKLRMDQCSMDKERDLSELKELQDLQRLEAAQDMPVLTFIVIFNSIIAPVVANAVLSKQCFQRVFVPPGPTTFEGSFSVCQDVHSLLDNSDLCRSGNSIDVVTSYDTPFIYRYQCSSSFINHYAALYVYTFLLTGFGKPIGITVCKYLYDTTKYKKLRELTRIVLNVLLKEDEFDLARIQRQDILFRKERFVLNSVGATCVLLTVGVVFPPVAVVVLFAIVSHTYLNQLIVGRFVSCFQGIEQELVVKNLCRDCEGVPILFKYSLIIILPFVSCFYAFYLIDIYGDETSWKQAMWVGVVVFSIPILCFSVFQLYRLFLAVWKQRTERTNVLKKMGSRRAEMLLDLFRPSSHWRSTVTAPQEVGVAALGSGGNSSIAGVVDVVSVENPLGKKRNVEMTTFSSNDQHI